MQRLTGIDEEWAEFTGRMVILCNSSLIAAGLVITQAFISVGKLNLPALISLICVALATPLLSGGVVLSSIHVFMHRKYRVEGVSGNIKIINFLSSLGQVAGFIGIVAAFWSILWVLGFMFAVCGFVVYPVVGGYYLHIRKVLKEAAYNERLDNEDEFPFRR
jgi:hypothetical protein